MEHYILTFRAPLKTMLAREELIRTLELTIPHIQLHSFDLDDKQFIMRIKSLDRVEDEIQARLLELGHRVAFISSNSISTALGA